MGRRRKRTANKRKVSPEGGSGPGLEQPGPSKKHVKVELKLGEKTGERSAQEPNEEEDINVNMESDARVVTTTTGIRASDDPFENFPQVVMDEYLEKYIANPKDKVSLCRAFPFAAKLLEPFKAKWIFNELFSIQAFRDMFSRKEVLNFRLVCGDWRKAISNYYESIYDMEPDYRHYASFLRTPAPPSMTNFRIKETQNMDFQPNLNSFMLNHMTTALSRNPNMDPFISKSAKFTYLIGEPPLESRGRRMTNLLDKIGDGLLSLEFDLYSHGSSSEILLQIKHCLERVPRLVSLTCTLSNYYVAKDGPSQEQLGRDAGLPPLPNLKSLSLNFREQPVYLPFTCYFNQLVALDVSFCGTFIEWYDPESHPALSNLKKLSIQISDLASLNKFNGWRSPLKELGIRLSFDFDQKYNVCPFVYLNVAQNFAQTLTTIKVVEDSYDNRCTFPIRNMTSFGLRQPVKLNLPQLRCISATIPDCGFGSVDHLLTLANSLEYLEVIVEGCKVECHDQKRKTTMSKLQIHGYLGNLYVSNIWTLLPSLAEVHVCKGRWFRYDNFEGHYTRERYEFGLLHQAE